MAKNSKKGSGKISLDLDKLEMLESFVNDNTSKINYATDNSSTKCGPLVRTGTFKKGYKQVEKGYSKINKSLNNYVNVVKDYYDDVDATQKNYMSVLDSFESPKYFNINDFKQAKAEGKVDLYKNDNKSVNEGEEVSESKYEDAYNEVNKELKDITTTDETEEQHLAEVAENMKVAEVGTIKKDENGKQVIFDEATAIKKEIIDSINKYGDTEVVELEQSNDKLYDKVDDLANVNKVDTIQQVELDESMYAESDYQNALNENVEEAQ